jgi:Cell cycle protein
VSTFPIALGRFSKQAQSRKKGRAKARRRSRGATVSAEYSMLLTATLCLLALGAVMVFSASSTTRVLSDGGLSDSAFYLKRTLLFGAVGLLIMHMAARHGLALIRNLTPAILGLAFFLLCAVLVAGTTVNGAAGSAPASCRSSPRRSPRWRWSSTAPTCSPESQSGRARSRDSCRSCSSPPRPVG